MCSVIVGSVVSGVVGGSVASGVWCCYKIFVFNILLLGKICIQYTVIR